MPSQSERWLPRAAAHAQTFPTKPVSIIVTSAPGGAADATARMLALHLAKPWNQQVIVENKPGGNTQLAADYVAKAAPDGHTLLLGPDVTFTVNPHLYRKLSYDPVKDFEPITGLTVLHQALVTHPSLAGEQRRRAARARESETGRAQLRDVRTRLRRPSQYGGVAVAGRREAHRRALSRRRAGNDRRHRRASSN